MRVFLVDRGYDRTAALHYPVDTLAKFKYVSLNDSSVIEFLSHSRIMPKTMYATWLGFYIGSYETKDHELRKVIFSNNGSFFYDSYSQRYYEIPESLRENWDDFITKDLGDIFDPNSN